MRYVFFIGLILLFGCMLKEDRSAAKEMAKPDGLSLPRVTFGGRCLLDGKMSETFAYI